MRRFEPIHLPEALAPQGAVSATFGRFYNVCPRSAFLYQKYRRRAMSAAPLERGSAVHRILELATLHAIMQGEERIPPEIVKDIANEVLQDPEYRCPLEEHDYIRESVYRWAEETVLRVDEIVGVETLVELDLGPLKLRSKLDLAELYDGGARAGVKDYKSSRSLPKFDDIGRKRKDGTVAAKDFQLVVYACSMVFGTPLRQEPCGVCNGTGWDPEHDAPVDCASCRYGTVEIPEPFALAPRAQQVDVEYVFPGIVGRDETIATRGMTLTLLELHEYMESLRAFGAQVQNSIDTGDWPASYGESHCNECTCQAECPIPVDLRRYAGKINSREDAEEAAEVLAADGMLRDALSKELNTWVKAQPAGSKLLRFGRNHVIEVVQQSAEEIVNRDELEQAIRESTELGVPFDRARFFKTKQSTRAQKRKLTEAELEELREDGNDGRRDEGTAGGADAGSGDDGERDAA